jgi:hydrogenase maturation protein HypF
MELEFAVDERADGSYTIPIVDAPAQTLVSGVVSAPLVLDWEPAVESLLEDARRGVPIGWIASRFHTALAEGIVEVAQRVGLPRVVLTGGCFQNRVLLKRTIWRLQDAGFRAYWPQRVPPNDGGIALGQIAVAARMGRAHEHAPVD